MKKYKWAILLLNLVILLVYFNYTVISKEKLLKDGQLVLLELAPVDPRSLIQGDYMTLRYSISEGSSTVSIAKRGYCVVKMNTKGVAELLRFQEDLTPLNKDEYLIRYTSSGNNPINIGAESYFFQEGHAGKYSEAKYGGVKIDGNGNSLLVGLYNEALQKIE